MTGEPSRLHASCVAIDGAGVLIRGSSGSGKSNLALRLIDEGAVLVADDQTIVDSHDGELQARAPAPIAGRLEVRGLGIVELQHAPATLALIVDLAPAQEIARLPELHELSDRLCGAMLPRIAVDPEKPDATARIRLALSLRRTSLFAGPDTLVSSPER